MVHNPHFEYFADKTLDSQFVHEELKNQIDYPVGPHGRISNLDTANGSLHYIHDEKLHRVAKYRNGTLEFIRFAGLIAAKGHVYEKLNIDGVDVGILIDGKFHFAMFDQVGSLILFDGVYLRPSPYGDRDLVLPIQEHFDFAGQGRDIDTGLISMGARDYDPRLRRFISPDRFFLESPEECVRSPKECDLYSYARNNPLLYTDSSGQYVETPIDVLSLASDLYDLYHEPSSWTNWIGLGLDVASVILPGVTGLGKIYKAGSHAVDAAKALDKSKDVGKSLDAVLASEKKLEKVWKITNPVEVMNHPKFKNFYKDGNTPAGNWWSKDISKHATWKVHKETSKGLEWIKDANEFGNYINKHKSEVGKFIPWDELRKVKP